MPAILRLIKGFVFYKKTKCIVKCNTLLYNEVWRYTMIFEWDESKERINISKHGIDFSTAALVFGDDNRIEKYDESHSMTEDRYVTIGEINGIAVIVVVVYTEREDSIRIISARLATKIEKEAYYNG